MEVFFDADLPQRARASRPRAGRGRPDDSDLVITLIARLARALERRGVISA
jgi:hypothetical protein